VGAGTFRALQGLKMAEVDNSRALAEFRKKLLLHKELDARLKTVQENVKAAKKEYDRTEDDLKALQSVGQIIGEVLRQLDSERLIVKASSGPRYVVGCRNKVDKEKLVAGTRVALDMTTLTIMRALPREVSSLYSVWDSGVLLHWESLNDLHGSSYN
jgi:26S proteasome regulatory subunit T4